MSNRLLVCSPSRVNSAAVASAFSTCEGEQDRGEGGRSSGGSSVEPQAGSSHAPGDTQQHSQITAQQPSCSSSSTCKLASHVSRPEQRLDRIAVEVAVGKVHAARGVGHARRALHVACGEWGAGEGGFVGARRALVVCSRLQDSRAAGRRALSSSAQAPRPQGCAPACFRILAFAT